MRLLQSKVNTKTMLRPGKPLGVPKRCGTLVSQLSPIGFGNLGSYLRAHGWNLPVWRPRPGRFVNCAFSALIYEVGLESPGLAPQTGRISRSGAPDREDLSIVRFQLEIAPRSHDLRIRIDDFADSKRAFSSKRVKEEDGGGFDQDPNPQIAKSGKSRSDEGSL